MAIQVATLYWLSQLRPTPFTQNSPRKNIPPNWIGSKPHFETDFFIIIIIWIWIWKWKMASCSMASAASRFMVTPNVTSNTVTIKSNMVVMLPSQNTRGSRLVVRAEADDAAPPAAAAEPSTTTAEKPKPPPIGPKRGTKVSIYLSIYLHIWWPKKIITVCSLSLYDSWYVG